MSDELLFRIFLFLPPKDQFRASSACKTWRAIATDPFLWKKLDLKQRFPSIRIIDQED